MATIPRKDKIPDGTGVTLCEGDFGWDYVLEHDDGDTRLIQCDWEYPGIAMTFGWSPCSRCQRTCKGATDGTIDCPCRPAYKHILMARRYLDTHIGDRVKDPGYFSEEIEYA